MKVINLGNKLDLSSISNRSNNDPASDADFSNNGEQLNDENITNEEIELANIEGYDDNFDFMNPDIHRREYVPLTKEELLLKRKMIMSIKRWHDEFGKHLGHINIFELEAMSLSELDALLEECKFIVCNRNSGKTAEFGFRMGIKTLERLGPKLNLKLSGLHDMMMAQEEINDLLREVVLTYEDMVYIPPEFRLISCTAAIMFSVDSANRGAESVKEFLDEGVDESLEDEFDDI